MEGTERDVNGCKEAGSRNRKWESLSEEEREAAAKAFYVN